MEDVPMPDYEPDSPQDPLLHHQEFLDLRVYDNFLSLESTYESMRMAANELRGAEAMLNNQEMVDLYPFYRQAHTFHRDRSNYRPNPRVVVQTATPPESRTPPQESRADAARLQPGSYLTVPQSGQPSRTTRDRQSEAGRRGNHGSTQGSTSSQGGGPKKRRKK